MKYEWHGNMYCTKEEDQKCYGQIAPVKDGLKVSVKAGQSYIWNDSYKADEVELAKKWVENAIYLVILDEVNRLYKEAEEFKREFYPDI